MHNLMKSLKVKALADKIPGWVVVGGTTLVTAVWGSLQEAGPDLLKNAAAGQFALDWPIVWHALAMGLFAEALYLKTDPWTSQTQAKANAKTDPPPPSSGSKLPPLGGGILAGALASLFGGFVGVVVMVSIADCSSAKFPELNDVETVVLADVEALDTNAQIIADVAKTLAKDLDAGPAVVTFVTAVAYDAMQFLIDMGIIPVRFLATAQSQAGALKALAGK